MTHVRSPCVAGSFYPGEPGSCVELLRRCLAGDEPREGLPDPIVAGIVPHAGWVFSGPTAGLVFRAILSGEGIDTFILFGAVHRPWGIPDPAIDARGLWSTPLGDVAIDEELAGTLLGELGDQIMDYARAHNDEHSLEVQIPFIQHMFPSSKIVPIAVPPGPDSHTLGARVARIVKDRAGGRVVALGSSDLTHYGEHYGFTPRGLGSEALRWAKEENDASILDLALAMKAEDIVQDAEQRMNACGPGAMAAAVGYAREMGSTRGVLLEHTTSHDVRPEGEPRYFVGYAGLVF